MEPDRQIEIQLGHMCNNRCVFCVSGQRTAMREAFPLEGDPIIAQLRDARANGMRKVTLLGGEPTLQPEFMRVVESCVAMGFDEIVLFTNGVKTARPEFVDEIIATGGNFTWRLSFQGATGRAHDRTTKKLGSFERLVRTLENLRARDQRITVNMCVVQSNFESVASFPSLLLPYGVTQLHLDMVRPLDAGVRSEEEMRAMIPRYADMKPHLAAMVAGFPDGFDVNIGNLPYCIAPELAPWIHHDGESTLTVSVDEQDALSNPWDKYEVKRRDKSKPAACASCVFTNDCSGVFDTYRAFYGVDELVPVTPERLHAIDPQQKLFVHQLRDVLARLDAWTPPAPYRSIRRHIDSRAGEVQVHVDGDDGIATTSLAIRRARRGGAAGTDLFSLHVLGPIVDRARTEALVRTLFAHLVGDDPAQRVTHRVGADLGVADSLDRRIAACIGRLRTRAPFGALRWRELDVVDGGQGARLQLDSPDGVGVTVQFAVRGANVTGGYRLDREVTEPSAALVDGVRAVMNALRSS